MVGRSKERKKGWDKAEEWKKLIHKAVIFKAH